MNSTVARNPAKKDYLDPTRPVMQRVEDLLVQMTLAEKISQLGSTFIYDLLDESGFSIEKACRMAQGMGQITRPGTYTLFTPRKRAEITNAIQDFMVNQTRLGIPVIFHDECCSGFTALGGTRFPQMIGLASTFRPELAEAMAGEIRKQMRATGSHHGLAPVLDIYRDPRWGRVEETFGEDPNVVARFGAAYIRGLQGDNLKEGVMATAKHFLGHSVSEGGLNCTPVHLGPRELRETFLLPYEAAVHEAHVATAMNSYSELDGRVVAADKTILRDLLRDELGFDGLVVSDYMTIEMLHTFHRVAASLGEAATRSMRAGIDLELPETICYGEPLRKAIECGDVGMTLIDEAVSRVLAKKFELGLFEHPYVQVEAVEAIYQDARTKELNREIAAQSLVLLKNDGNLLPLPKGPGRLAVIGPNATTGRNFQCDYSHPSMVEVLLEGLPQLRPLLEATGSSSEYQQSLAHVPNLLVSILARVTPDTRVLYSKGCDNNSEDRSGFAEAIDAARKADYILLVLGDRSGLASGSTSGEFNDRATLELPGVQEELVRVVLDAAPDKPVVAVLINGRPLAFPWLNEHVQAVLEAWLPGDEGGPAIADALFGTINPGGKLPVTLPRSVGQLPIYYNQKPSGGHSHFRGDYIDQSTKPLYVFGHGLSYTTFEYSSLTVTPQMDPGGMVRVTCEVRNTGKRSGDEVAQLYIQDEYASLPRPVRELKGFRRIHLAPGQAARVTFDLTPEHLAYYDEEMALTLESGRIRVLVGASSADIRLESAFHVTETIPVSQRSSQIIGQFEYVA